MARHEHPSGGECTITLATAVEVVSCAFIAAGMPPDLARDGAETIVDTEAHGQSTHGLAIVPQYLRHLGSGEIEASARPRVAATRGATALIDGEGSLGQLGSRLATRVAGDLAVEAGIGLATVRGSNHAGALGPYARMLTDRGMIGIVLASSVPSMLAPGGTSRTLGNNPLAIGCPTLEDPVVLDMAMSTVARRRISLAAQAAEPIPLGWARDARGVPTADALAALAGSLEPFGGEKSAGLAVMVGLLATALGGAAMGPDLGDLTRGPRPGVDGLTVIAIQTSALGSEADVRARASASIAALRGLPAAEAGPAVRMPGDRSARAHAHAVAVGIRVPCSLWDELVVAAEGSRHRPSSHRRELSTPPGHDVGA